MACFEILFNKSTNVTMIWNRCGLVLGLQLNCEDEGLLNRTLITERMETSAVVINLLPVGSLIVQRVEVRQTKLDSWLKFHDIVASISHSLHKKVI